MILVFLDTNVFLDAILDRGNNYADCQAILDESKNGLELKTSPYCLLNVIYFLKKAALPNPVIIQIMDGLLKAVSLAETSENIFRHALHAGFTDLEDAIQYYTALQVKGMDYFITSNTKDFKKATAHLPVISPKQFITLYKRKK